MKSSKFKVQGSKGDERSSRLKVQGSTGEERTSTVNLGDSGEVALRGWLTEPNYAEALILRDGSAAYVNGKPWDLLDRTAVFGELIVKFSRKIPRNPTNNRLIDQLVGAGTGIGANYCEANEAVSAKDFKYLISHCMKEVEF